MHPQGSRCRGRTSLVAAFFLAVAVCAVVLYILLRGDSGARPGDGAPPALPAPSAGAPAPSAQPAVAQDGEAAKEPAAPDAVAVSEEAGPHVRLFGTVADVNGAPLGAMCVRWVPTFSMVLGRWRHDANAFGKAGDAARIPGAELREALARSLVATTGDDGKYELKIPESPSLGAVAVMGAGYEAQVKGVGDGPAVKPSPVVDAPPETAPAPREFEVSFALKPACSISGTVLDRETRAPAAGMIVVAGVLDPQAPPMMAFVQHDAPCAVVGGDGAYALQGLPLGEHRVVPRSGDTEYVSIGSKDGQRVVLEKGIDVTGVDFLVSRGGTIFGIVAGPDEQPVAGAQVRVMPADMMTRSVQGDVESIMAFSRNMRPTGDDGAYEYGGLPLGKEYRVIAAKEGLAPQASEAIALTAERPRAEVDMLLTEGCALSGTVTYADGTSAPKTEVYLLPSLADSVSNMTVSNRAVTDDAGAFRFEHLPAGELQLRAGTISPLAILSQEGAKSVVLDGVADVTGIVLVIEKTTIAAIAGTVLDTWGNPVEGAQVSASDAQNLTAVPAGGEGSARTNAEGKFALADIKGEAFRLRASKPGYSPAIAASVPAGTQNVELRLAKHGRISGWIVTAAGAPPGAGGKVFARPITEDALFESIRKLQDMVTGGRGEVAAEAREDGSYSVEAPAGKVEVQARVPGFAPGCSDTIEVVAGQDYQGVKIVVTAGAVVRGRVTLGDGAAVEGAVVRVERKGGDEAGAMLRKLLPQFFDAGMPENPSNADGRFLVEHLAEGEYLVSATHKEYAPSEAVPVALSRDQVSEPITLVLKRGGAIEGAVIEGDAPKPSMMVQLMSGGAPLEQRMTDATGQFRFEHLAAGEYILTIIDIAAMQKGKFSIKTRVVAVQDEQASRVDVEIGKGFKVFGKVKGYPPAPMRMLTLRRPGGPAPEDVKAMDIKASIESSRYQAGIGMLTQDDTYEIADIEPGTYILEAPRLPADPTDMEAYAKMENREPYYRREITLKDKDIEHDVDIK